MNNNNIDCKFDTLEYMLSDIDFMFFFISFINDVQPIVLIYPKSVVFEFQRIRANAKNLANLLQVLHMVDLSSISTNVNISKIG